MLDGKITTNNAKNAARVTTTKNAVCGAITIKDTTHGVLTAYAPYDHNQLYNRETSDQHPIEAITGLRAALDAGSTGLSEAKEEFNAQLTSEADLRQTADQKLAEDLANEKATREAAIESAIDTNKTYVDDNFVPKQIPVVTKSVYTTDTNGEQSLMAIYSESAEPFSIAARSTDGVVRVGAPIDASDATTKKYVDDADAKKLNLTGGTIAGSLAIQGDLTVAGTTTTETAQTLAVKDSVIVTNADGAELGATLSGIAIRKDGENTYGVMYDPSGDSVKLGLGTLDSENRFTFNDGGTDGKAIATRADSSELNDGHLVRWDSTTKSLVDSGIQPGDIVKKYTDTYSPAPGEEGVYGYNNGGEQTFYQFGIGFGNVPQYVDDGNGFPSIPVVDKGLGEYDEPIHGYAVSKEYVQQYLERDYVKRQIVEYSAYTTNDVGETTMVPFKAEVSADSIVRRDSSGHVRTAAPEGQNDATTKEYVDSALDKKLDTYTGTAYYPVIPVQKRISASDPSAGYFQAWEQMSVEATNNTVAKRTAKGTLATATPISDKDATPKKYVEDNFVAKQTTTTPNQSYLYGYDSNGDRQFGVTGSASPGTIAYRSNGGRLQVGTPVDVSDATTKAYVDDGFVAKITPPDQFVYAYGYSGNTPVLLKATSSATANQLAYRGTGGTLKVGTAVADSDAMPKKQVEDGFVKSVAGTVNAPVAYIRGQDGTNKTASLDSLTASSYSVAQRDVNGNIKVGTPKGASDATPKAYIDNLNTITITAGA